MSPAFVALLLAALDGHPATDRERQACEQNYRKDAEVAGESGPMFKRYLANCMAEPREDWAKFRNRGNQYESWLICRATAARLDACNPLISRRLARKKDQDYKRSIQQKQGRQRKAVAALAVFRDHGLISARNFRGDRTRSKDFTNNGWFAEIYEDSLQP